MGNVLEKLPSIIVLSSLVALFLSLNRNQRSIRVRLWATAWSFILFHYLLRTFFTDAGHLPVAAGALDILSIQVAGVAFLVSVSQVADYPRPRLCLMFLLLTACVMAAVSISLQPPVPGLMIAAGSLMLFGGLAFFVWWHRKVSVYVLGISASLLASGVWVIYEVGSGNIVAGLLANLFWLYFLAGVFFVRRYRRASPGVTASFFGFMAWASIWAFSAVAPNLMNKVPDFNEWWNVPKYIVGIGMIVVLLEDQYLLQQSLRQRERVTSHQMEHFAEVTSRLLYGAEVKSLCGYIAEVITHVTNFRRVAVLLTNEDGHLYIGGHSGIVPEVLAKIELEVAKWRPDVITAITKSGRQLGRNSFICAHQEIAQYGAVMSSEEYPANSYWRRGDELIVPLLSPRGEVAGCLSLDEPRDVARVIPEETSKLELLANDLAAAIERNNLQRELIRSEKLAGVGQLVAGVAHELNNPLTAVLGYAEMMAENASESNVQQQAATIQREALRMKRIIENLLRFCRHSKSERRSVGIRSALEDVLRLCAYQLKHRRVRLDIDIDRDLPAVTFDEDQLKQVFLNLLNNSLDAMENSPQRRLNIEAKSAGDRVRIVVRDTGKGFSDPGRVFDPFFTTKVPGKGTGLGLSVCYGILKEHGGDIYAYNLSPVGAGVSIEIPVAGKQASAFSQVGPGA